MPLKWTPSSETYQEAMWSLFPHPDATVNSPGILSNFSIRIDDRLRDQLTAAAAGFGISIAELCRRTLHAQFGMMTDYREGDASDIEAELAVGDHT